MQHYLAFQLFIDAPLVFVTIVIFLFYFNSWSSMKVADTSVDLRQRLPQARVRVVAFFLAILAFCWFVNIGFWIILAVLFGAGVVVATIAGDQQGSVSFLLGSGFLIREWAFGFPELILQPPKAGNHSGSDTEDKNEQLVGSFGIVISSLRPFGEIEIGDQVLSVVSEDGGYVEVGATVRVLGTRNGRLCVRLFENEREVN